MAQGVAIVLPIPNYLNVGEKVTASIVCYNFPRVSEYQIVIAWDPNILECLDARDVYNPAEPLLGKNIDNTNGTAILYNLYTKVPAASPNELVQIDFKAKAVGTTTIAFWAMPFSPRPVENPWTWFKDAAGSEIKPYSTRNGNTWINVGETPTMVKVYGTVTDRISGATVSWAQVCMDSVIGKCPCPVTPYRACSDPLGYYEMYVPARETPYQIACCHPSYLGAGRQITITGEQRTIEQNFQLCQVEVAGSIQDACTGTPFPGQTINITVDGYSTTVTADENGKFGPICLPPGTTTFTADVGAGYCPLTATIETAAGKIISPLYLNVPKKVTITGTVYDSIKGTPIQGATVRLSLSPRQSKVCPYLSVYYETTSDEHGNFTITDACACMGAYTLNVWATGYKLLEGAPIPCVQQYLPCPLEPLVACKLTYESHPINIPATIDTKTVNSTESVLFYPNDTAKIRVPKKASNSFKYKFYMFVYNGMRSVGKPTDSEVELELLMDRDYKVDAYWNIAYTVRVEAQKEDGTPISVPFTINDTSQTTPYEDLYYKGESVTVSMQTPVTINGQTYTFDHWLGTTNTSPTYTIESLTSDTTLTAVYKLVVAPDFTISASPSSLKIAKGGSGKSTITVTSVGGFSQPVALSVLNVPPEVTAKLEPETVTPMPNASITSTLTINVSTAAQTGIYTLKVVGKSDTITKEVDIALTITDFTISASPSSLEIQQGASKSTTITVTSIQGFSQPVNLSVSGAPAGVTPILSRTQVTPPPGGSDTSTLTVAVSETATPGTYTLTVTGTSGALTHSTDITLKITEKPPEVATVYGRVLSMLGPVADAEVSLNGKYTTKTAADGSFRIENVAFGTYTLTAKPTRIHERLLLKSASKTLTITTTEIPIIITLPINILNIGIIGIGTVGTIYTITKLRRPKYY
jgi:hypothetical protein